MMADLIDAADQAALRGRDPWIRVVRSLPSCDVRLLCFPHAGGAASFFREWGKRLPPGVELWAVQYPGRENRIDEPFLEDMGSLVAGITEAVSATLDCPTVFFGHSMGALVGYEVARRLSQEGRSDAVRRLVVSGCAAPHRTQSFRGQEGAHRFADDDLAQMVRQVGGVGASLLDDPDMRSVLLPAIRNDYRLVQSYVAAHHPALSVDVTALVGEADAFVSADGVRAWSAVTSGRFAFRSFPGGHFYVSDHVDEVLRAGLEGMSS